MYMFITKRAKIDCSPLSLWERQEESCIIHAKGNLNRHLGKTSFLKNSSNDKMLEKDTQRAIFMN